MNPLAGDPAFDVYDPDDVVPRNSPLLAHVPTLRLSPDPPPLVPRTVKASQGDGVLVGLLDGGRHPEIAMQASNETLPSESGSEPEDSLCESDDQSDLADAPQVEKVPPHFKALRVAPSPRPSNKGAFNLESLESIAAAAMAMTTTDPPLPEPRQLRTSAAESRVSAAGQRVDAVLGPPPRPATTISKRDRDSLTRTGRPMPITMLSPYSPNGSLFSPRDPGTARLASQLDLKSPLEGPPPSIIGHSEGLAPIYNSPQSEVGAQTPLPSIHTYLKTLEDSHAENQKLAEAQRTRQGTFHFPHSPPGNLDRLPPVPTSQGIPISPAETFRGQPVSPNQPSVAVAAGSPMSYYGQANSVGTPGPYLPPPLGGDIEMPLAPPDRTDAGPTTMVAGLRPDPGNASAPPGIHKCPECDAPPFSTQYLLNSHMNVHSQKRPHFCSVKGCPRSEGGKGFKRKNEMIRHGLVHQSPGYMCPFCPDKDHKYPRPDNLQRHVRVHHGDRDKDDPALREVLAARSDGGSRGRRRRLGPSGQE